MSGITFAQVSKKNKTTGASTLAATFASVPPQDSVILVHMMINCDQGPPSPSLSGSGWTLLESDISGSEVGLWTWYKKAGAGENKTVTCSGISSSNASIIVIQNFQGTDPSSPIDVHAHSKGNSSTADSGSVAMHNVVSELVVAAFAQQLATGIGAPTNSFTTDLSDSVSTGTGAWNVSGLVAYRDYSSPSTGPAHSTASITSAPWVGSVVAIRERLPVTYAKTGTMLMSSSKQSGFKSRDLSKFGFVKMGTSKQSGVRARDFNKTGKIFMGSNAISGSRPGFWVKTGKLVIPVKVAGQKLYLMRATLTRDTTMHFKGVASGHVHTSGTVANQGIWIPFTPLNGGIHTGSVHLYGNVPLRIRITDSIGTDIAVGNPVDPNNHWVRFILTTPVSLDHDVTYRLYAETVQAVATDFWVDAIQMEQRNAASAYSDGIRAAGFGPVGAALRSQKPAGLVMAYLIQEGQTFEQLRDTHTDFQDVRDDYEDFEDARDDAPTP